MRNNGCGCRAGGVWKGVVAGFIGGAVGSLTMELFQTAWNRISERLSEGEERPQEDDEHSPATVKVASIVSQRVFHKRLTEQGKRIAGPGVHYGFGATMGGLYGAIASLTPQASVGAGLPFGLALWLAADEVAVPSLGLSEAPAKTPLPKHVYALSSHLVYGLTTDLVRRAICRAF